MNNLETIKDKIRKLLALSKSDNEHEAAAALEKANELIAEYNLDENTLQFKTVKSKGTKTYVPWRNIIQHTVAWLYGCHTYRERNNGMVVFTGEDIYAFLAGEMHDYLVKTIERHAKKAIRKNSKIKYRRDFKYGMACRIDDRIKELGQSVSWAPERKAKIEAAEEFVENSVRLVTKENKKIKLNRHAVLSGFQHGGNVSLARQAGFAAKPRLAASDKPFSQVELF